MDRSKQNKNNGIIRLLAGAMLLLAILIAASKGMIPASQMGGVIGHNMAEKIDATPLIYSESEDMERLEQGLKEIVIRKDQ